MIDREQVIIPSNHPVKFYKIIAITFLVATIVLFGFIVFMSSKRATITVITKPEPVEVSTTVGINTDEEKSISGAFASTTVSLSEVFDPTGTREEEGVATGIITVINETNLAQPLVATTRFLTPDGVLFRLTKGVIVPAQGSIDAEVYADKKGETGNIGSVEYWKIPGLNENKWELIYGKSENEMKGGIRKVGILSQSDIDKAQESLTAKIREKAENELASMYPDLKGVFTIGDIRFEVDGKVGEEVAGFSVFGSAAGIGIFYDEEALLVLADSLLQQHVIDDAEIVEATSAVPTVAIEEFDMNAETAVLTAVYTGEAKLNPESKQLDKLIFYGKTKDEVRRYLLSLDHVFGVEVDFRPAWMHTVPHVPDHVKVIVRDTE